MPDQTWAFVRMRIVFSSTADLSILAHWSPFVMLARGGSIALWENFKTDEFWNFGARHGTRAFLLVMGIPGRACSPRDREISSGSRLMVR